VNGLRKAYTKKYVANAVTAAYALMTPAGARSNHNVILPRDVVIQSIATMNKECNTGDHAL
jgi:hypothetical protein